ncbi:MAG: hypothetical protein E6Q97_07250 [Desulfurellales bacterium]|nr:MAG: hypothetical protein E6Q97_07250 [Desulfurellales bacterium]
MEDLNKPEMTAEEIKAENARLKAEVEAKTKQIGQAEHTIETLKSKAKTEVVAPEPKPEINVEGLRADIMAKVREELLPDVIEAALAAASTDPEEREKIRSEYQTAIVKTGLSKASIENDIRKAALIVRSEKNATMASEIAAAAHSSSATVSAGGATNQDRPEVKENWKRYLSANDLRYMTENKWPEERMKKAALAIKAENGL